MVGFVGAVGGVCSLPSLPCIYIELDENVGFLVWFEDDYYTRYGIAYVDT